MTARVLLITATAILLASACASDPTIVPDAAQPAPLPPAVARYLRAPAPAPEPVGGSLESAYGCTVTYELYEPFANEPGAPLIVIAHGFMRDLTAMRGWAEHWSARGHRAVAVSFCNSSWLNGRHDRNAEDLVAVADLLTSPGTPVLYAGFSAGGLAALLAGSAEPDAVGYLGLDPVDSGGLASGILTLDVPGLYLYGEPSSCNADSNMVAAMPEPTGPAARLALRVPFATHCDFESPYDEACSRICGSVEPEPVETEIRATIRSLATAWVEAVVGEDASAASVFAPDQLGELERSRRIARVGGE